MAVNYAEKYSNIVDERFLEAAQTAQMTNNAYDMSGVKTVKVYSIPTSGMNDYKMTGDNRYGTPEELENTVQELTMKEDRSFTFTIDKRNESDTMGLMNAGSALSRQLGEVVIPEVDCYRMAKMALNAGTVTMGAVTKSNAYEAVLDASVTLTNRKVPVEGRILAVTPGFYKKLKLDSSFVKASDLSQEMLVKGQIGAVDNMPVKLIADSYFVPGAEFMIAHPIAACAAQKLADYKIHENPPGINGYLVEGRIYHDVFVLDGKKYAIYHHQGVIGEITVESVAGTSSGKTKLTVKAPNLIHAGAKLVYKTGVSQAAAALGADVSDWTALSVNREGVSDELAMTNDQKVAVAVSIGGKAIAGGVATIVSAT